MSFRFTAIMLAVFAILGGVVWFSEFRDKGASSASGQTDDKLQIFKFEDADVKQLDVVQGDQKGTAVRDDQGNWTLPASGQPGDRTRISSIMFRLSNLQASKRVADAPTDLAQYGLDNPPLVLTVTLADGTTNVLQTGVKAPTDPSTYAKRSDNAAVYLVNTQLVTDLGRFVTDPPIELPTPTPAPIPSPPPTSTPSQDASPTATPVV